MNTIFLEEPGRLSLTQAPPLARPLATGEARVRVHRIGVCGTDIHAFGGRQPFFSYPRILGHELGVEVLEVATDIINISVGDRCSVEPYMNCGRCIACRRNKPNCCISLKVLGVHTDGGMREEFIMPAHKLHSSASLNYDQLALVETLGIGCHAVQRASLESGEFALVIGAGPIGLAVTQFALEAGAKVILMDISECRLGFCRGQLGVQHAIHSLNVSHETILSQLSEITNGDLPTAVFDATGNPQSMKSAFQYPAAGGRMVFVGLFPGEVSFDDPNFHRREMTLMGSRNAHPSDFSRIIRLIEEGRINTTPWITHRAKFSDVPECFPLWTQPSTGVIKAMIEVT
ncbi:MAG: zinc-binding alcohol dehydrogenase family protein [Candidatus Methylacidiphilales bacterium]